MWQTEDGVVHSNRIAMPGHFIDPVLRERLDRLTDIEKVSLFYALSERVGEYTRRVADSGMFDADVESAFDGLWLPDIYKVVDAADDIESLVVDQVELIPRRWQIEFLSLVPDYLLDTGPKWRKWKRIVRNLGMKS